jgi:RNA polymerase sigma-70 factor (ECF subfamily)
VSFAAISHTQRTSSNLLFRRVSGARTPVAANQGRRSPLPVDRTGADLVFVCREGAAGMDITDKKATALENGSGWTVDGTCEFAPEEHAERVLRLFRRSDLLDKEVVGITRQRIIDDPHERLLALYKEYRPRLFGYLYSLYLDQDEADEVIQETFLLLTRALRQENGIENVPGWIVRVAHHLAVDVIKRKKRNSERMRSVTPFQLDSITDPRDTPEQALLKKDQKRQIDLALAQFNPQHRQCFYMRAQGFRYKDIGMAFGLSEQRVALIVKNMTVRLAVICG